MINLLRLVIKALMISFDQKIATRFRSVTEQISKTFLVITLFAAGAVTSAFDGRRTMPKQVTSIDQKLIREIEDAVTKEVDPAPPLDDRVRFYARSSRSGEETITGIIYLSTGKSPYRSETRNGGVVAPESWRPAAYVVPFDKLPTLAAFGTDGRCRYGALTYNVKTKKVIGHSCL